MNFDQPHSGYTLPVFACAAAVAALNKLHQQQAEDTVAINLINPEKTVKIAIEQVAKIGANQALAITRSDPGDNLDLTRNTPVWALVELRAKQENKDKIMIQGGEGIGIQIFQEGKAAIYRYAQQLLRENLKNYLEVGEAIEVTIILPEGKRLAKRTSNAAFGVVEGLSLLGTSGISQPLTSPKQLEIYRQELAVKAKEFDCLVFCLGENGLDLATKLGINPEQLIKTANWLGPLLVEAGLQQVNSILLFGYHGKLIKLAGGIFHTHHHLADGRLEILTAYSAKIGLPTSILQQIFTCKTTEDALNLLRELDAQKNSNCVEQIYSAIADAIDNRSQDYIRNHAERDVCIGSVLFDRDRNIIIKSHHGLTLLDKASLFDS